jgi:hypothetical protein
MKITILIFSFLFYGVFATAQVPADSAAYFKDIAAKYKALGFPESGIVIMVQAERERLYPEIAQKAKVKRDAEGSQRAKQFAASDKDEDDAEAQKMMNDAIRKMGKNPAEVNKKMAEVPLSRLTEIPGLSTKEIAVTPASQAALLAYLIKMAPKADAALSAEKKNKAAQYLGKGRETGYTAIAFWVNKEHDLALYLLLKASIQLPQDNLLLNNFATCLSMSGLPEKAIPILEYLKNKLPDNATILNNLGQAQLGMGNIIKAKVLLEKAVLKEDMHPEANRSLSKIALKEGNIQKAVAYLEKAMSGGFDNETYNQWHKLAPGKDVAAFIRLNHKKYYKEVPITKRWMMPDIPSSVREAQDKEHAIQQFFADLDATRSDMPGKIQELKDEVQKLETQQVLQMQQQSVSMKSLDDVQKYNSQFGKFFHPYKFQAQLMLNSIRSNDFATSYSKRIGQAVENREKRLTGLYNLIKPSNIKINELNKLIGSLEGGEKGDEELKIQEIQKEICALRSQIQKLELAQLAEINTQYMKMVEDILDQRLQEEMYWTALYAIPNNPSADLYSLYSTYLSDLANFKSLYPLPAPSQVLCDDTEDKHKAADVHGKLQLWEDNHCPIDINYSLIVVEAKMNCREIKLGAKINGVSIGWDRKIDAVTWETLEHSISIAAGIKEFETNFTDQIKGKVGIDGKFTIKLDKDLIPTDIIVKTEAGVELSGPMGSKAGADLGSVEISVQGGLRGEGAVPGLVSKMFGD